MMKSIDFRPFSSPIVGLAALCAVLGFASSATALPLGPIPSEAVLDRLSLLTGMIPEFSRP